MVAREWQKHKLLVWYMFRGISLICKNNPNMENLINKQAKVNDFLNSHETMEYKQSYKRFSPDKILNKIKAVPILIINVKDNLT